jgi:hypothetical protein
MRFDFSNWLGWILLLVMGFLPWIPNIARGRPVKLPTSQFFPSSKNTNLWKVLFSLGVVLVLLAFIFERNPKKSATSIVLDLSGSMAESAVFQEATIPKIQKAKQIINQSVGLLSKNHLIGITTFSNTAEWYSPLIGETGLISTLVNDLQVKKSPGEAETNISDALVVGLNSVKNQPTGYSQLLLLTDGEHNVENALSGLLPEQVAGLAKKISVPIHVIDLGGNLPANDFPELQKRKQARNNLRSLALATGGKYLDAAQEPSDFNASLKSFLAPDSGKIKNWVFLISGFMLAFSMVVPGSPWRRFTC